ncbi:putative DNA-binding transcriptional regulator YafY [Streptomyces sp. PvR006]|uniref:helix-turn-helix transcriptional regulator n=1 Tax=Streptomyces sp. PvR006 TaxID=2817860 RepID=UPI001AE5530A|nr:YafY family protein [Streptomyces sp. PvR006]MBP2583186.1 putative DNA-binding transcriptional regulator YafY [Streptomyces sp. PvR006]
MPADRLLSMMLLLQTRGRMSARRLAAELGVSVRTAYRDLDRLQASGVPVYAEQGRSGGYQLLDGYRTHLTGLSESEARVLFLAGLPAPAADLGLAAEVAAARLKLLAALPAALREEATRTDAVFHLDAPGWYREAEETPCLPLLVDAVFARRTVDVRYRRWREPREVRRLLHPYGLVLKSGTWYLVAGVDGRPATFRIARILDAVVRDEPCERPQDFVLEEYWASYLDDFDVRRFTGTATIRLSPRGRERLADNVPAEVARACEATATEVAGGDGWIEAVIPTESTGHACGELLRLGTDVEVVAPEELRRAMADTVRALARTYAAACPPSPPNAVPPSSSLSR